MEQVQDIVRSNNEKSSFSFIQWTERKSLEWKVENVKDEHLNGTSG